MYLLSSDFRAIASSFCWLDYSTLLFNCPYCRKFLFKLPSTIHMYSWVSMILSLTSNVYVYAYLWYFHDIHQYHQSYSYFLIITTRICQKYGAVHHQLRFLICVFLVGFSHGSQAHDCNGHSIRDAITALDDPMEAGELGVGSRLLQHRCFRCENPWKTDKTNMKKKHLKSRIIFQNIIFVRSHVSFQGCKLCKLC